MSMTCMYLSIIDQYFATCSHLQWHRWSHIKVARVILIIFTLVWMLHNIPMFIFYDPNISTTTNALTCGITHKIYQQYHTYCTNVTLEKLLPVCLTCLFGLLAYRNIQQLPYRVVPIVRRELDKQLTVMVLLLTAVSIFTVLPFTIVSLLITASNLTQDPLMNSQLQFAYSVIVCLIYLHFAVSLDILSIILFLIK